MYFCILLTFKTVSKKTGLTYLPFRANSIDLMAVVLLVPVVTLKEATRS